jgi:ribosomal protein L7/L12
LDINFCPNCGKENFRNNNIVNVVMKFVPPKRKLEVIKELRIMYQLGLSEAKGMTDKPSVVVSNVGVNEASSIKSRLERAGAIIEITDI